MAINISQAGFPSHGVDPRIKSNIHPISSSGGWSPSGSPVGHWSADTISGLSDGDPVGTWPDQSGNNNDLTQATAGNKPTYKTAIQNGLPVVRFDGTDDYMEVLTSAYAQPNTVFIVAQAADTSNGMLFDGIVSRNTLYISSLNWSAYAGTGDKYGAADTTMGIWAVLYNGAASWTRRNAVADDPTSVGAAALDDFRINWDNATSAGWAWGGDICEIVLYNGSEAYADNENGLNTKWAVY